LTSAPSGVELVVDMGRIGLGEDGPDGRGDHLGRALGHLGKHVSEEVDAAALEGRAGHDRADGLAQTEVGIGDHQHPTQPTGLQAAQECRPVGMSSLSPTATPRTSRRPSPHTPVAATTAWATTRRAAWDAQLQIPGRGRQHPRAMPVALGNTAFGALVRSGADHRGELGFDQGLVDGLAAWRIRSSTCAALSGWRPQMV
jgi:hypothetical protein